MKAKEHGVDLADRTKSGAWTKGEGDRKGGPRPFNAFRELGLDPKGGKRKREDDGEGGRSGQQEGSGSAKEKEPVYVNLGEQRLKVNDEGKLENPEELQWKKGAVLGFSGAGEEAARYHEIRVSSFELEGYVKGTEHHH